MTHKTIEIPQNYCETIDSACRYFALCRSNRAVSPNCLCDNSVRGATDLARCAVGWMQVRRCSATGVVNGSARLSGVTASSVPGPTSRRVSMAMKKYPLVAKSRYPFLAR